MNEDPVTHRYLSGEYAESNPDWDASDSPWKAERVESLLADHGLNPASIVEIGCGAGGVLAGLRARHAQSYLAGYDIAPGLARFWEAYSDKSIRFVLGDFLTSEEPVPDLVLVLDVIEHLGNPFEFLTQLKKRCRHVVFHFPLDLSALSVARETPLLLVRKKVGHLHYFTRRLALALLDECGFDVIEARYTGAAFTSPSRTLKTRLASLFRRLLYALHRDAGVLLLGGETLMILARPRNEQ